MKIIKIIIFISRFISKCEPALEFANEYFEKREKDKQLKTDNNETTKEHISIR